MKFVRWLRDFWLANIRIKSLIKRTQLNQTAIFPLKGGDIVVRGVIVGHDVSRILRALQDNFPGASRIDLLLNMELNQ